MISEDINTFEEHSRYKPGNFKFTDGIEKVIENNGVESKSNSTIYDLREITKRFISSEMVSEPNERAFQLPRQLRNWIIFPKEKIKIEDRREYVEKIIYSAASLSEILQSKITERETSGKNIFQNPFEVYWDIDKSKYLSTKSEEKENEWDLLYYINLYPKITSSGNRRCFLLDNFISRTDFGDRVQYIKDFENINSLSEFIFLNSLRLVMLGSNKEELQQIAKELNVPFKEEETQVKEEVAQEDMFKTRILNQKELAESIDYSEQIKRQMGYLEKLKAAGILKTSDPFFTGKTYENMWQSVHIGKELEKQDHQRFRGYLMISPQDLIKSVDILLDIGLNKKSDIHFKWLINYRDESRDFGDYLTNLGHYNGLPPTNTMLCIYGNTLDDIQKVLRLIAQYPEIEQIENNRRKYLEDYYKIPPRRPGTNTYEERYDENEGTTMNFGGKEYRCLCFNDKPGYSEHEDKEGWRDIKQGLHSLRAEDLDFIKGIHKKKR